MHQSLRKEKHRNKKKWACKFKMAFVNQGGHFYNTESLGPVHNPAMILEH